MNLDWQMAMREGKQWVMLMESCLGLQRAMHWGWQRARPTEKNWVMPRARP